MELELVVITQVRPLRGKREPRASRRGTAATVITQAGELHSLDR